MKACLAFLLYLVDVMNAYHTLISLNVFQPFLNTALNYDCQEDCLLLNLADAKFNTFYFLGPTFIGIIMPLWELN